MTNINAPSKTDKAPPNAAATDFINSSYEAGFSTPCVNESFAPGLNEEVIRRLSALKNEPRFLLDFRLKAFAHWQTLQEPHWPHFDYAPIDYQSISYYSAPKSHNPLASLEDLDPEIRKTYERLGVPLHEQKILAGVVQASPIAIDAVFDSVSVGTTFKAELAKHGIIFCSFSEAVQNHPELIQQYLGTVVSPYDNFFAALNAAVFSDGSFCYIPPGVRCPMELSTYFRINAANTGQFERTLLIADKNSIVSYLEGCSAPARDQNQLHAAVVELIALEGATIKYSTLQNWYPGDAQGQGGIYNFVTKRGICKGAGAHISWTQVETGSALTWKYPSVILQGDNSVGAFYSVALSRLAQSADTGTKMIHIGKNTKSTIVSKSISADRGQNTYRGIVRMVPSALGAKNFTQCDSLLFGESCSAHTFPLIELKNNDSECAHEASTANISPELLFYLQQRGLDPEEGMALIVNGFCKSVFKELPMEFAVEAQKLLAMNLEGSIG